MGKPLPAPVRDDDREQRRLNARRSARRARLIEQGIKLARLMDARPR